tara:strand:- start:1336 stop:1539 length:204 start_codon:yes stop_codon:yes gene_type:complete
VDANLAACFGGLVDGIEDLLGDARLLDGANGSALADDGVKPVGLTAVTLVKDCTTSAGSPASAVSFY